MPAPLAPTPPMGWNSFDCYDLAVTEEDVLGNARYLAAHLKAFGWEYVVIDGCWYDPASAAWGRSDVPLVLDQFGRYQPCPVKFPSSTSGAGFKPIADQVHALGLKFGIHIMRGIARQAVRQNTPILGTDRRAQDIADTASICSWWEQSYGVNAARPGAQEWYDSNLRLYADWGVDFIKADDLSFPYARKEIELLRSAIDRCGRDIVLSLSPGETPIEAAEHVARHANLWRISGDFWDQWPQLLKMFALLEKWSPHIGPGHWPDADMLPLGALSLRRNPPLPPRFTRFTPDEQRTLMTLWCIARSPLMFGGDLRVLDPFTTALVTNTDVLHMHRTCSGSRVLFHQDYRIAWTAEGEGAGRAEGGGQDGGQGQGQSRGSRQNRYLALFNTSDLAEVQMSAAVAELGFPGPVRVRELWTREELGVVADRVQAVVPPHGAKLYRLEACDPA